MAKGRKVGTQISGGKTNLGKLGQKGVTGRAGTGTNLGRLGSTSALKRNTAKMASISGSNLRRKAHGP